MTLVFGHRGAGAERPENTIESFEVALQRGADVLEMDVHLSRDGVVVVHHDPSGRRMAGVPREIRNTRFDELQKWDVGFGFRNARGERCYLGQDFRIPSFAEVLERFPHTPLNVDIKTRYPGVERDVIEVIRRHKAEERVLLASFYDDVLERVRALGYAGATGLSRQELQRLWLLPKTILSRRIVPIYGQAAQVPLRHGPIHFDRAAFIQKCHRLKIRVDFWTVNDAATALRLAAMGADGIITDDPGKIRSALSKTMPQLKSG